MESAEYKEIKSLSITHAPLPIEPIKEAVAVYFSWAMLSHRWDTKEPGLHDIQEKDVYTLDPVGTVVKLQMFCEVARDAGHRWAWSDTCCIDQKNNAELSRSVNSMFVWYHNSALTIVYLSDVPPSSKSGALAKSAWNTRGWTVQEFLAPGVVIFYQADWTPYLGDCSPNHKKSATIMQELANSTGIDARSLLTFRPGMTDAREKLRWVSKRITTLAEDVAYSLFGIFGIHLHILYGETKENALGRLLQEVIARSGDITALDWVGKPSGFNSCLPADIAFYNAAPSTLPSLSESDMQASVSKLQSAVTAKSASALYNDLDILSAPRFAQNRLHLPCIAFRLTEVTRSADSEGQETSYTRYNVKAKGLRDLLITTKDKLVEFSPAQPTQQKFVLVRPWNRYDFGLPDFADDAPRSKDDSSERRYPGDIEPVDSQLRESRLIVRLGQPFGALLLAQQRGGEYKRIASDRKIMARVKGMTGDKDMTAVYSKMKIGTLEIL
ncbi:heterokaryon incompatibility protein-domain-containing protein [Suillus paluster]|uniref:heterokaryon incompatibility protein-domain-containing protein n=1 Tax=Suillus paluster TaxID=48578 RepID=UPI001B86E691|nr:heterokaryon incompatibility protein-domain-containing protein [Suillus paluster]KAG1743316.1 heterokaryon incompatibility protein-domain-containing protein [Suillus paluster]